MLGPPVSCCIILISLVVKCRKFIFLPSNLLLAYRLQILNTDGFSCFHINCLKHLTILSPSDLLNDLVPFRIPIAIQIQESIRLLPFYINNVVVGISFRHIANDICIYTRDTHQLQRKENTAEKDTQLKQ